MQGHELDLLASQGVVQHLGLLIQLVYGLAIQVADHLDLEHGDVVLLDLLTLPNQLGDLVAQAGHISRLTLLRLHIQLGLVLGNLVGQLIHGLTLIHGVDVNSHIQVAIVVIELVSPAHHDMLWEPGQQEAPHNPVANTQVIHGVAVEAGGGHHILEGGNPLIQHGGADLGGLVCASQDQFRILGCLGGSLLSGSLLFLLSKNSHQVSPPSTK